MTNDLGDPTSYLELETGVPVFTSDGREIGTVAHVLADDRVDIFDGLVVATDDGHRFADASVVGRLHRRGAVLTLDAAGADRLPEPSENPPALSADPDDTTPDHVGDRLRRAWDWLSGNY